MSTDPSRIRATTPLEERFGFACGLSSVPVMARAHRHDDVEFTLPLGGRAVMDHAGTAYAVEAGRCAVFWAGLPHRLADTGDPDVAVAWLTVPLVDVLAWPDVPAAFVGELLRGDLLAFDAPPTLEPAMASLAGDIGRTPLLTTAARREAEAWVLRASERARPTTGGTAAGAGAVAAGSRVATTMASWISEHFRDPVSVADVASVVHLHPGTARAAFRRELGVTIGEYLAQCRTAEAQRLLLSTDATTTEVALRSGFGSTSRFYARFVQDVGMPPAAYRRQHASTRRLT